MFDLIFSGVFILLLIFLIVQNAKLQVKNNKLKVMIIQSEADKKALSDKFAQLNVPSVVHDDGFVKFLTQSRDWAYAYIEGVQAAIKQFKDSVGPQVSYYRDYGDVMWTPLHDLFGKVADSYDELIKVLPEDEVNEVQT